MRGYARLVWYLSDGLWYPWLRAILSVTLVLCQLYTSLPQATNKFMRTHNIVHKANLYGITHKTIRSYRLNCARRSYAQTEKLCRDKLFCFVWTLGSRFPETIRISDDLASSEGRQPQDRIFPRSGRRKGLHFFLSTYKHTDKNL